MSARNRSNSEVRLALWRRKWYSDVSTACDADEKPPVLLPRRESSAGVVGLSYEEKPPVLSPSYLFREWEGLRDRRMLSVLANDLSAVAFHSSIMDVGQPFSLRPAAMLEQGKFGIDAV
jgi:hypothetical protein